MHYSGHGAVVVGELDGAHDAAHRGAAPADAGIRAEGRADRQYLGLSLGQAHLRHTAVRDRADRRQHRRRAGRPPLPRRASALAQEVGAVATGERRPAARPSTASIPTAFAPGAPAAATERSFDDMVAHNRRSAKSHSGIWRDLAVRKRKTEVDAQLGCRSSTIGRELGMATPLTRANCSRMIHEIEDGKRPLALANLDELDRRRCAPRPAVSHMNIAFDGRTVVVTGAAHGFGRAIAIAFAAARRARHGLRRRRRRSCPRPSPPRARIARRIALDATDQPLIQAMVAAPAPVSAFRRGARPEPHSRL